MTTQAPASAALRGSADSRSTSLDSSFWAFLLTEMSGFALLYGVFVFERRRHEAGFVEAASRLDLGLGVANTVILLLASLAMALAVQRAQRGGVRGLRPLLLVTAACGVAFLGNKVVEWSALLRDGSGPQVDLFHQLYFTYTGLHAVHVLIALAVVAYLWRACTVAVFGGLSVRQRRIFVNGGLYWHLVDLLWIGLFATLYCAG